MMLRTKPSGSGLSDAVVDEDIEGRRVYNIEDKLSPKVFNDTRSILKLASKDVSYEALQTSGFDQPILVKDSYGLGLRMPPSNFGVRDVQKLVEPDRKVQVIDAMTQTTQLWTMKEWVTYYTSPKLMRGTRVWNVISLEFSGTKLDPMITTPSVVRELDWAQKAWPLDMIYVDMKSMANEEELTFPKVFKYCLMSVAGCYTDFHIDLGGTSVWYHIFRGRKIFWLIPPTEENIQKFIEWSRSGEQEKTFLGDICAGCQRISLREGNTFFIPSGWIHAVYTPVESLVFGGNFLHSLNVGMQLRVLAIEETLKVPPANRYPFFHEMQWYAYDHYNIALTQTSYMSMDSKSVADYCDIIDTNPVLSKHELAGLMNLREWLPNQEHETYPDDLNNRQKLLDSMMVQLAQHKQDAVLPHSPRRRSILQWKPSILEQYKKRWEEVPVSISKVHKATPTNKPPKLKAVSPEPVVIKRPRGRPRIRPVIGADVPKPKKQTPDGKEKAARRSGCHECSGCLLKTNCGKCTPCLDMPAFGGQGRAKQKCVRRKCVALTGDVLKPAASHHPARTKPTKTFSEPSAVVAPPRKRGRPPKFRPVVEQVSTEPSTPCGQTGNASGSGLKRPASAAPRPPSSKKMKSTASIKDEFGEAGHLGQTGNASGSSHKRPASAAPRPPSSKKMKSTASIEDEFGEGTHQTAEEFGYTEAHLDSLLKSADSSRLAINGGDIVIYRTQQDKLFVFVRKVKETGEEADQSIDQLAGHDATEGKVSISECADGEGDAPVAGSTAKEDTDSPSDSVSQQSEDSGELGNITCVTNMMQFLKSAANEAKQGKKADSKLVFICKSKTASNDGSVEFTGQPVLVESNSYLFKNALKSSCAYVKVVFGNVSVSLPSVSPRSGDMTKCADLLDKPMVAKGGSVAGAQPVASWSSSGKCSIKSTTKESSASSEKQLVPVQPLVLSAGKPSALNKKIDSRLPVRVILSSNSSNKQPSIYATPVQTTTEVVPIPVCVISTGLNVSKPANTKPTTSVSAVDSAPRCSIVSSPLQGSATTVPNSGVAPTVMVKNDVENSVGKSSNTLQVSAVEQVTTGSQNKPLPASHDKRVVSSLPSKMASNRDDSGQFQTQEPTVKAEASSGAVSKVLIDGTHRPVEPSMQEETISQPVLVPVEANDDRGRTLETKSDGEAKFHFKLQSSIENGVGNSNSPVITAPELGKNVRNKSMQSHGQQENQTSLQSSLTLMSATKDVKISTDGKMKNLESEMQDGGVVSNSPILDCDMGSDVDSEDVASDYEEADMASDFEEVEMASNLIGADLSSDYDEGDVPSDFDDEYMESYIKDENTDSDVDGEKEHTVSADADMTDSLNEDIAHFGGDVKIIKMNNADVESHTSFSNSANESSNDCPDDGTIVTKTFDDLFGVSSKKERSPSPPSASLADRRLRGKACGECEACCADDCRKCIFCKDMRKYGGRGRLKQKCKYKKCTEMNHVKRSDPVASPPTTPKVPVSPTEMARLTKSNAKALPYLELSEPDKHKTIKVERRKANASPVDELTEQPIPYDAKTYSEMMRKQASDVRKLQNCGECINCLDKKEFGGPGKKKQMCMEKKSELQRRVKNLTVEDRPRHDSDEDFEFTPNRSLHGRSSSRRRKLTRKMEESLDQEWTDVVKAKMQSMSDYASNMLDNFLESLQDGSDEEDEAADSQASESAGEDEGSAANELSYELLHDLIGDDPPNTLSAQPGARTSHLPCDGGAVVSAITGTLQLGKTQNGLTSLDLTKKVIDAKLVQEILHLQPEVITLNKAISTPKTLRSLLSGLTSCTEMSLKGVNAVVKAGLSEVPFSVTSLNLSANLDLSDQVFSSLFCKLNIEEALLGIQWLDVSHTAISDNSVRQISKHLPLLQTLQMSSCNNLTNNSLAFLADSHQLVILEELDMTDCEGVDHQCLQLLIGAKGLSKLKSLNFNGCPHISSTDIKSFISSYPSFSPPWTHNRRHMLRDVS